MKQVFTFLCVCFFFHACTTKGQPAQKENTPAPLQDKKIADVSFSKRGADDMVENLYEDLKDKNASLAELEKQINEQPGKLQDSLEILNRFEEKNNQFYDAANSHLNRISDSALRKKMNDLIGASIKNHETGMLPLKNLTETINSKKMKLMDVYTVLKLVKTLPLIHNYQQGHIPSVSLLSGINSEYDKIISTTEKMTRN